MWWLIIKKNIRIFSVTKLMWRPLNLPRTFILLDRLFQLEELLFHNHSFSWCVSFTYVYISHFTFIRTLSIKKLFSVMFLFHFSKFRWCVQLSTWSKRLFYCRVVLLLLLQNSTIYEEAQKSQAGDYLYPTRKYFSINRRWMRSYILLWVHGIEI